MNAIAFNGSSRANGNTAILLGQVLDELEKEDISTQMIQLAGQQLAGCIACGKCWENKNKRCSQENDRFNEYFEKMIEADAIILGSPTYFADITSNMMALICRAGLVSRTNGDLFQRKVGAAIVAVRRAGAIHAFDSMNHFFFISQMIVAGSSYWNIGIGSEKGEVEGDDEGLRTMKVLGQNTAWLLKKLHQ